MRPKIPSLLFLSLKCAAEGELETAPGVIGVRGQAARRARADVITAHEKELVGQLGIPVFAELGDQANRAAVGGLPAVVRATEQRRECRVGLLIFLVDEASGGADEQAVILREGEGIAVVEQHRDLRGFELAAANSTGASPLRPAAFEADFLLVGRTEGVTGGNYRARFPAGLAGQRIELGVGVARTSPDERLGCGSRDACERSSNENVI